MVVKKLRFLKGRFLLQVYLHFREKLEERVVVRTGGQLGEVCSSAQGEPVVLFLFEGQLLLAYFQLVFKTFQTNQGIMIVLFGLSGIFKQLMIFDIPLFNFLLKINFPKFLRKPTSSNFFISELFIMFKSLIFSLKFSVTVSSELLYCSISCLEAEI